MTMQDYQVVCHVGGEECDCVLVPAPSPRAAARAARAWHQPDEDPQMLHYAVLTFEGRHLGTFSAAELCCASCGAAIPPARLNKHPTAQTCSGACTEAHQKALRRANARRWRARRSRRNVANIVEPRPDQPVPGPAH